MSDTVLVAVIGGLATAIPTLFLTYAQHKQTKNLLEYRMSVLETKVGVHNGFEARLIKQEEKMAVANHRIDDLEKKAG